jgi:deazaflavin-dependent oxidoreductase (nitroreductase family)
MPDRSDMNRQVIDEFRANGGTIGSNSDGPPLLLLHTTGAKSGLARVNPLMYERVDDDLAVFASNLGAPTNPGWYHNLRANPYAQVELGTETFSVTARQASGDARDRIWASQQERYPHFSEFEKTLAGRKIAVFLLSRTD